MRFINYNILFDYEMTLRYCVEKSEDTEFKESFKFEPGCRLDPFQLVIENIPVSKITFAALKINYLRAIIPLRTDTL